jgi:hypothetical protein
MIFKKITRRRYEILTGGTKGNLFLIDFNGNHQLRIGPMKGITIELLYEKAKLEDREDIFFDQLELLYEESNWIDRMEIREIYYKLTKNNEI